jgi:hypothetical protein
MAFLLLPTLVKTPHFFYKSTLRIPKLKGGAYLRPERLNELTVKSLANDSGLNLSTTTLSNFQGGMVQLKKSKQGGIAYEGYSISFDVIDGGLRNGIRCNSQP